MEALTECIFYDKKRDDCKALKQCYCKVEAKCSFFKNKEGAELNGLAKNKHRET